MFESSSHSAARIKFENLRASYPNSLAAIIASDGKAVVDGKLLGSPHRIYAAFPAVI